MTLTALSLAAGVGLISTLHCVSMCGGIMGALVMGLPGERRAGVGRLLPFALSYNLGRITSYALAGALLAGLGAQLGGISAGGHEILRIGAGLLMIGVGLYLAGWFPQFIRIEHIGTPVWRRLEPLGRRIMPVNSTLKAFGFGLVWGWLPCGLVYSILLSAAGQGSAWSGALYMLAFGLGTLPSVLITGLMTGHMAHLHQIRYLKELGGVVIIALALLTLAFPGIGMPDGLHDHEHHH